MQVDKITMLQMIKENNTNYFTLDDFSARNIALTDTKYFLKQYWYLLLSNEIQYRTNFLEYIKIIEADKNF